MKLLKSLWIVAVVLVLLIPVGVGMPAAQPAVAQGTTPLVGCPDSDPRSGRFVNVTRGSVQPGR